MVFLNLDETRNLIKCENYEKIQDTGDFNNIGAMFEGMSCLPNRNKHYFIDVFYLTKSPTIESLTSYQYE